MTTLTSVSQYRSSTPNVLAYSPDVISPAKAHGTSETRSLLATRNQPDWNLDIINQLAGLFLLRENWDSYGAKAPNLQSIKNAQILVAQLSFFADIERPLISVSPSGNVAMSWEWAEGKKTLDLEVDPDGVYFFAFLDEADESRDRDGATSNLREILQLLTDW